MMLVDVWLNRRVLAAYFLHGYQPGDALEKVAEFAVDATEHHAAAELVFALGNLRDSPDAEGVFYPADQRSISVGDVIVVYGDGVRYKVLACAPFGWKEIRMPLAMTRFAAVWFARLMRDQPGLAELPGRPAAGSRLTAPSGVSEVTPSVGTYRRSTASY